MSDTIKESHPVSNSNDAAKDGRNKPTLTVPSNPLPSSDEVRFANVTKRFIDQEGAENGIFEVNRVIRKGQVVTIVGPSGSGKSTLLSLCNLLLTPDEGQIFIQNKEVRKWAPTELRKKAGLVFQNPTMFPGTVSDNLRISAHLHRMADIPVGEWLQRVGLSSGLADRSAGDLSGGQKQRVALARTLINEPDILLLDEVTSALDPAAAKDVEELILDVQSSEKKTVLWVTHNLDQAKRVSNETWLIVQGRLVEAVSTVDFFSSPQTELAQRFLRGELSGRTEE